MTHDRFQSELERRRDRWNEMFPADCPEISRSNWDRLDEVEERFWRCRKDNDWGGFTDWLDRYERVLIDVLHQTVPMATFPPPKVAGPSDPAPPGVHTTRKYAEMGDTFFPAGNFQSAETNEQAKIG